MSPPKSLNVLFYSMDLVGPQNACIGLGQVLRDRGHRVRFLARQQTTAKFVHYGFECFGLVDTVKKGEDVIKGTSQMLQEEGFFDDLPPIEKMKMFGSDSKFMIDERDQVICFEPQIRAIVKSEQPDLVVLDSEVVPPSLICQSDFPWIDVFCSTPTGLFHSKDLPPFTSGLPTDPVYRPQWEAYAMELDNFLFKACREAQQTVCETFGCPRNGEQISRPLSPFLNVYQFPAELDYDDLIEIPANYVRVDAYIREEPGTYELPAEYRAKMKAGDKLIYVSMGSMGSFDIRLMKKLVSILGGTKHWYIVSKGQLADEYELADNMTGSAYLPQTRILPLVDIVITHCGNNSLTESIYYGKPTIVMPMFYDQFDNAQRVHEKQFGVRLNPFNFEPSELLNAIERVLTDEDMHQRLRQASARIQQSKSKVDACKRIEEIVSKSLANKQKI